MKLNTVTISGPDDKTTTTELLAVSDEYPFVEWGILLSSRSDPRPRYPTPQWIRSLDPLLDCGIRFSGHVCGGWASKICKGRFAAELDQPIFRRMQLNVAHFFQAEEKDVYAVSKCLPMNREYIVQAGPAVQRGLRFAAALQQSGHDTSVLFDASGGHGLIPDRWPTLVSELKCGFAGGLGPKNLEQQLSVLSSQVGDTPIWIDMESGVRTEDGDALDFAKVRACLDIARQYVRRHEDLE